VQQRHYLGTGAGIFSGHFIHVYCWICWWKNFENRSRFGEVMGKSRVLFSCFWLTGYICITEHVSSTYYVHVCL